MSAREILTYSEYLGYSTVTDETNSDPRLLQRPSQNVYVDWNSAIRQRKGLLLCGTEGSVENGGIKGTYTFVTPKGVFHSIRVVAEANLDVLQRLVKTVDGNTVTWSWDRIGGVSNFTGTNDFVTFAEINDTDSAKTYLIIGTGNQYINYWDGTYARVESQDIGGDDIITIEGTQSLIDLGFIMPDGGTETLYFRGGNPGSFTYTGFAPSDDATESITTVTFNTSTNVVTATGHRIGTNTPIKFTTTDTLPTGITADEMYFVVDVTTNTFKVAEVPNGDPINLSGSPSGTHTLHRFTGTLDTFVGVTVTSGTIANGDRIYTSIFSQSNSTLVLPSDYTIDFVGTYRNQLYIGSRKSRTIRISSATSKGSAGFSFANFSTSSDVGGARTIPIDDTCGGFEPTKDGMVIFGDTDSIFKRTVTVSSDQTKEFSEITRLETAPRQGLVSPLAKLNIKNALVYLTNEKTLDTLSFLENISELQSTPISDIIKQDFEKTDFTGASVYYFERNLFVLAPASFKIFWYDLERKLWQTPITFTQEVMGLMSVTEDGNLLIHSAQKDSSFFMFQGDNDNGDVIESNATFAYNHLGARYRSKIMGVCVQDGYITPNGLLRRVIEYGFEGTEGSHTYIFDGNNRDFINNKFSDGGLGKVPLGQTTLGGNPLVEVLPEQRFLFADNLPQQEFYMARVSYSMNTLDASWSLVAYGMDVGLTKTDINRILIPASDGV